MNNVSTSSNQCFKNVFTPSPQWTKSHTTLLKVQDVLLDLKNKNKSFPILKNISLTVHEKQFVSIIGPSGCGKSTLFKIIGGLISPDSGKLYMDGTNITGQQGHISYMPQNAALFPWRTIEQNVMLGAELLCRKQKHALTNIKREAEQWLKTFDLYQFSNFYPSMLSGGMQQRISFLRAVLTPKPLMLLDEPFSALDAITRTNMQHWLLQTWEKLNRSVLLITHSITEALLLSDCIYVFSNRPATVLKKMDVPFSRPRDQNIVQSPLFQTMKKEITNCIQRYVLF